MEEYVFETEQEVSDDRVFVLIIYDIIENKKRLKLAKLLEGYGIRIQKSAFEGLMKKTVYQKLLRELPIYASDLDSIRVYKIIGKGQITVFGGNNQKMDEDDLIFI